MAAGILAVLVAYLAVRFLTGLRSASAALAVVPIFLFAAWCELTAWRRIPRPRYRRYRIASWAAYPLAAAAAFAAQEGDAVIAALAALLAALVYLVSRQMARQSLLAELNSAVGAQRCPVHGEPVTLEMRRSDGRFQLWIDGCCQPFVEEAKATLKDVYPVRWLGEEEVAERLAGRVAARP
jgi:hypothetical protein